MQIYAHDKTKYSILLDVEPNDTIDNVKIKIHDKTGILSSNMKLVFNGIELFDGRTLADYNIQRENIIYYSEIPISNACFPANTLITTDQGEIEIQLIDIEKHTIHQRTIVAVVQTRLKDNYLIRFDVGSLGPNSPNKPTIMSPNHAILYKDYMIKAKFFSIDKVTRIAYTGEILYNIVLQKHAMMIVNNIIVETLRPDHILAKP